MRMMSWLGLVTMLCFRWYQNALWLGMFQVLATGAHSPTRGECSPVMLQILPSELHFGTVNSYFPPLAAAISDGSNRWLKSLDITIGLPSPDDWYRVLTSQTVVPPYRARV